MTITAKIIADSIGYKGQRLTTFSLHYPRFIHSELMTHRVFSRNSSSSRAIPVQKMIDKIMEDPAMPVFWGKNQPGMQAMEELSDALIVVDDNYVGEAFATIPRKIPSLKAQAIAEWLAARDSAVKHVKNLLNLGLHKQIANRPLEPWMHQDTVVTATYWGNWYNLRYHTAAQPEIRVLAEVMLKAHNESTPIVLKAGEWHLPYVFDFEKKVMPVSDMLIASSARCARVSYMNHEGKPVTLADDKKTFGRLLGGGEEGLDPKHASPAEHQAKVPDSIDLQDGYIFPHLCSNLQNWVQHRKYIKGENLTVFEGLLPK